MKLLQIDGRGFFFRRVTENPGRSYQELVFPWFDLVGMNVKLLREHGEGSFAADGGESHLRFERRTVIPAGASGQGSSPVLGKIADLQAKMLAYHPAQIFRATSVDEVSEVFDTERSERDDSVSPSGGP